MGWLLRDISLVRQTELRRFLAEKSLSDSLVETAEVPIVIADLAGRILRCNPFLLEVSGYHGQDLRGERWCDKRLIVPESCQAARHMLHQACLEGSGRTGVLGFRTRSQERRFVTWTARSAGGGLLLVGQDVTALQEAQRQAVQRERLAAIGEMAAGLAHESRNALQRGQACLSILSLRLKDQPEFLELLQRAQKSPGRLARPCSRMFARMRSVRVCSFSPATCGERGAKRGRTSTGMQDAPGADLREDADCADLTCPADPFLLKQALSQSSGELPDLWRLSRPYPDPLRKSVAFGARGDPRPHSR